jgi:hypothetical protein
MSANEREEEIVELKKLLREDDSGEATQALIHSLREAATPIATAVRGTLSQEEYVLCEDLLQALQTAEHVLTSVWESTHPHRRLVY